MSNNILISGTCGCPGSAVGRILLWRKGAEKNIKDGDIIVLLDTLIEIPVWAIQKSGGIVSCAHTSYSHLVSAAMFLNKPCIVGAKFSSHPTNFEIAFINAFQCVFYLNGEGVVSKKEIGWYQAVSDSICGILNSSENKTLAHIVTLDNLQYFVSLINGVFLDATVFQNRLHKIPYLIDSISEKVLQYPSLKVHYRFSKNPTDKTEMGVKREIEFICALRERGIDVSLFFPNASTYSDIVLFNSNIREIFADSSIKTGAMIESYQILNDIEVIATDKIIDFAVVGINDFMSSCLGLNRDDPINQSRFSLDNRQIEHSLAKILKAFQEVEIPCYIGYPKYNRFLDDIKILMRLGFQNFFGTPSLFEITQRYRNN